jgi:putative resolvase
MNGSRAKVRRLLADPKVTTVVIEHRDRLGRMNTELAESAPSAHGHRLVVLDDGEVDDDLVRDMVESSPRSVPVFIVAGRGVTGALKAVGCAQGDIGSQAVVSAGRQYVGHE